MPIRFNCPGCRAAFSQPESMGGKKIRCSKCSEVMQVPPAKKARDEEEDERGRPSGVRVAPAKRLPALRRDEDEDRPARRREDEERSSRRRRDEDEDDRPARRRTVEDERPVKKAAAAGAGTAVPWLVGGAVACVAVLTVGVIVVVLLLRPTPPASTIAEVKPPDTAPLVIEQPTVPPPVLPPVEEKSESKVTPETTVSLKPPAPAPPPAPGPGDSRPPEGRPPEERGGSGRLSREAMGAVKRATVYIEVTMPDGGVASGTGFFGAPGAGNVVLTNAHVVGMLDANSLRPKKIEVYLNHGQPDEKKTTARVLGVDRSSDLAVIDVGTAEGMPPPLTVTSADKIQELDNVVIFGFPLGKALGKEITIRPSSVSSLRKDAKGSLDRIQVNGGMDPGNSGGPVVDDQGHVVGVAVSGIPGRQINFAIPGERVHIILNGRISGLGIGQPFKTDSMMGFPAEMEMIDPLNRVKEVAIDVWAGDPPPAGKPGNRPPSDETPAVLPGDTPHQRVTLTYLGGLGKGDVTLPEKPPGKVWWTQPSWSYSTGKTRWASAGVFRQNEFVERKPAMLRVSYVGAPGGRGVTISSTNTMKVSSDDDSDVATLSTKAIFNEAVKASPAGTLLQYAYRGVKRDIIVDRKAQPSRLLDLVKPHLKLMTTQVSLDARGNVTNNVLFYNGGRHVPSEIQAFHDPFRAAIDATLMPLPGEMTSPMATWQTSRMVVVDTPEDTRKVQFDLAFTYLGVLNQNGKEVAVVSLKGKARDKAVGGTLSGALRVETATGLVRSVNMDMKLDMPVQGITIGGKVVQMRVLSIANLKLERDG